MLLILRQNSRGELKSNSESCWMLRPLPLNQTIVDIVKVDRRDAVPVPWIKSLTEGVTKSTYQDYLIHLTSYPTRHSLSKSFSTAAEWASIQLNNFGFNTRLEKIRVETGESYNLVGERIGQGVTPRDIIIVSAHLDSVNDTEGLESSAPGADDNASGCAAFLEIARILASFKSIHDLRLILFGGEEQNLVGQQEVCC